MKKKFSVVLSCLAGIAMLAYSALPVQAMITLGNCSHPNFALGIDVPTGEYEYLESGHYQVWGMGHACLSCGYEYYTDTHLVFDSYHDWESLPSDAYIDNEGITTYVYDCRTSGCDKHYIAKTQVI